MSNTLSVYILVGDSFIPNKIFFNKQVAFDELKKTSPYKYILTYNKNRRDENSSAKLVAKYTMHKSSWEGTYNIQEEKLWDTDDTDYGFLYNLDPEFTKMFEHDNIIKFKKSFNDFDRNELNNRMHSFPEWLKKIINELS